MWVFTTIGFFSIVAHRDRPDCVLVRARDASDLRALVRLLPLPRPKVQRTPHADYLFRAVVPKQAMARLLATLTEDIDYDNFKDAVARRQGVPRARIYHNVWHALLPLQQPKLAIVKSKPKHKFDPNGGMVFGEVSAAEMYAIESAKAERVERQRRAAEKRIAAMPPALIDLFTSEYCVPTVDKPIETIAKKKSRSTKEDPDAGMMPDPSDPDDDLEGETFAQMRARMSPEQFARLRDQSKGEGISFSSGQEPVETDASDSALRARMGEAQFQRFLDQADGRDIRCFDKDGEEI